MHGLATSPWLDRPDGLRKVLDWSFGGYSMDIGSVRPVFNEEGVDDCFYGMGECTATSFAWATATQSMEAFPNAPLAANDLAALTTGEALIVARFPNSVTVAQLAEEISRMTPTFEAIPATFARNVARTPFTARDLLRRWSVEDAFLP